MMMMMMMMMNCFYAMVDLRKMFSLISSRNHCQRPSPPQISDKPRAGFETEQNLSSSLVEWSCAVVITTAHGATVFIQYVFTQYVFYDTVLTSFNTVWLGLTEIFQFVTKFAKLENITYCNYRSVIFHFQHFVERTCKLLSRYVTDFSLVSNSFKVEFLSL